MPADHHNVDSQDHRNEDAEMRRGERSPDDVGQPGAQSEPSSLIASSVNTTKRLRLIEPQALMEIDNW